LNCWHLQFSGRTSDSLYKVLGFKSNPADTGRERREKGSKVRFVLMPRQGAQKLAGEILKVVWA
jgi:hypothetical protein